MNAIEAIRQLRTLDRIYDHMDESSYEARSIREIDVDGICDLIDEIETLEERVDDLLEQNSRLENSMENANCVLEESAERIADAIERLKHDPYAREGDVDREIQKLYAAMEY